MQISELTDKNLCLLASECKELKSRHLSNPQLLHFWNELGNEADNEGRRRTIAEADKG